MTPSEVETMLENLNTRTTAIEQILPTLATKDDLTAGLGRVETRLDALKSHVLSLIEKGRTDYEVLSEHLAQVPSDIKRLTEQGAGMKDDIRQLAESLARMSQDLGNRLDQLAQKIDSPRRRR